MNLTPANRKHPNAFTDKELKEVQERLGLLVNSSEVSLDPLYLAVGDVGCRVILADRNGVAIARRGAAQDALPANQEPVGQLQPLQTGFLLMLLTERGVLNRTPFFFSRAMGALSMTDDISHAGELEMRRRLPNRIKMNEEMLAKQVLDHIMPSLAVFIERQPFFFIATASDVGACDANFRGRDSSPAGRPQPC